MNSSCSIEHVQRLPRFGWLLGLWSCAFVLQAEPVDDWLITLQASLATKPLRNAQAVAARKHQAEAMQAPVLRLLRRWQVDYRSFWVAPVVQARLNRRQAAILRALPQVRSVQRDQPWQMPLPRGEDAMLDRLKGVQANLAQIGADLVWAAGITGAGVTVGIQDTGMEWNHPLLQARYRGWDAGTGTVNHDYAWHDAIVDDNASCPGNSPEPCDDNGHGTHVTGTVAGDGTGVAPGARWIGCRNMDNGWGTAASYIECFQWFLAPTRIDGSDPRPDLAPAVISNSWYCPPSEGCAWYALQATVDAVEAAGILVVSAAGNDGPACDTVAFPPAMYASSFTVGAVDGSGTVAGFSSRGVVTMDNSDRLKPEITAPGVSVVSAWPGGGTRSLSGTSMATPHVAGLAALLLQANPALAGRPGMMRRVIRDSAQPAYSGQGCGGYSATDRPNAVYGWGIIQAWAAYQRVLEPVFENGYEL